MSKTFTFKSGKDRPFEYIDGVYLTAQLQAGFIETYHFIDYLSTEYGAENALSAEDYREIADMMIFRWRDFKKNLKLKGRKSTGMRNIKNRKVHNWFATGKRFDEILYQCATEEEAIETFKQEGVSMRTVRYLIELYHLFNDTLQREPPKDLQDWRKITVVKNIITNDNYEKIVELLRTTSAPKLEQMIKKNELLG